MVAKTILKALARPGGPASKLPSVNSLAAAGIKKVAKHAVKRVRGAVSHAAKSGALVHAGNSVAKGNMMRGLEQMKGPIQDKMYRFPKGGGGKVPMMKR